MPDSVEHSLRAEAEAFLTAALDCDERVHLGDLHDELIDELLRERAANDDGQLTLDLVNELFTAGLIDDLPHADGTQVDRDELSWTGLKYWMADTFKPAGPGGIGFFSPASTPGVSSFVCDAWVYLSWDEGDGEDIVRRAFPTDAPPEVVRRWTDLVDAFLDGDFDGDWAGPDEWWRQ
jgi:hypothetical protein